MSDLALVSQYMYIFRWIKINKLDLTIKIKTDDDTHTLY